MGIFDLLKPAQGDAPPAANGAASTAPDAGAPPGNPRLSALASKARAGGRRAASLAAEAEAAQQAAALEELFETENWEEVASLYFDCRFAMTGDTCFELSDKRKRVLAVTMAKAMRVLMKIDPAYIALSVFAINFGGAVVQCEAVHYDNERRKAAKAQPIQSVS